MLIAGIIISLDADIPIMVHQLINSPVFKRPKAAPKFISPSGMAAPAKNCNVSNRKRKMGSEEWGEDLTNKDFSGSIIAINTPMTVFC